MKHNHRWEKTGEEQYSFPGQYEEKCATCNKTRWKEYKEEIPIKKLTEEARILYEKYLRK